MSVLAFPRLYFEGYLSWDPNVTNNTPRLWDPVNVNVRLPQGVTPATYQQFVIDNANALGDWDILQPFNLCLAAAMNAVGIPLSSQNGMRNLLHRWADLVIAGTQAVAMAGAVTEAVHPPQKTLVREAML